jgi:hypothetical protein
MQLKQHLLAADRKLQELDHPEESDSGKFDVALGIIGQAHKFALESHNAYAAKVVEKISGPISPLEARRHICAMLAALVDETDILDPPMVAKLAKVSPDTVRHWCRTKLLRATNIGNKTRDRWKIKRDDLDRFLKLRSI